MTGHGVRGLSVMAVNDGGVPPILAQKHYTQPSAFTPENLLREARRQKQIVGSRIPDICVLDPDGDIVRSLLARGEARLESGWAWIAEEMFASGCKLLISVTSSGQIVPIPAIIRGSTLSAAARLISELSVAPSAPRTRFCE